MFSIFCMWPVLEPKPNVLIQKIRKHPQMHDEEYAKKRFGEATVFAPLVLPYVQGESRRIIYKIIEYDPLLDSSDMSNREWVQIANDIKVSKHFSGCFCITFFSGYHQYICPHKHMNSRQKMCNKLGTWNSTNFDGNSAWILTINVFSMTDSILFVGPRWRFSNWKQHL